MSTDPLRQSAMVHEALGKVGALPPELHPMFESAALYGPAFTVETAPGDNTWLHYALAAAPPGSVIVCSCGGAYDFGYFGEVMAVAAHQRGLAGLLIDGKVRDTRELQEIGFPVFARGRCITGTRKGDFRFGGIGGPISIGHVTILPGDFVIGDRDGVVVVDESTLGTLAAVTAQRADTEERWIQELRQDRSSIEVLKIPSPP
jgi:4-hydroxy-4-methyl-2-oxoglutarate aldolase